MAACGLSMMWRSKMCRDARAFRSRAFTLVEVIVAAGLMTGGIAAAIALLGVLGASGEASEGRARAARLGDSIAAELVRLRDLSASNGRDRLEILAAQIPSSASEGALRLVGSSDGRLVRRELDADDAGFGLPPVERFFLIEIRTLSGDLDYAPGTGFIAVQAVIRWPYFLRKGPGSNDAVPADLNQASTLSLNIAVPP
jgi:hypothetical protein